MNIGVVLDLSNSVDESDETAIRALLEQLSEASDVGDRFSLTVAGHPGGTLIEPGSFGYGPVTVANQQLFGDAEMTDATVLSLEDALIEAIGHVTAADDPSATLGSSLVLLVTPGILGAQTEMVVAAAHETAVAGIPTSVVGVGADFDLVELDRVALAGQGNRRLLRNVSDAERVVSNELAAAARVVARAVRLRIRLAPGVELVDVLGSYSLDEVASQQVRDAEQSVDQRLSRNLGIQADRGEDEDGIQIVIPAYYADDAHVILLDVVAPGPGALADVTVRYKDLVTLRNGVARDNITLERGERPQGPLELNVLKNLLAYELSQALKRAAGMVADGDVHAALIEIGEVQQLIAGLQAEVVGFETDPEIMTDIEMVAGYLAQLEGYHEMGGMPPTSLADSLLYAGFLKTLEPPNSEE